MKYIIGLVGMLLPLLQAVSQPSSGINALNIGDTVPPVSINNILNYSTSKTNLTDLKDKLVILDFMATGCVSCIEELPRFDSLQKKFGDQLIILLVSYEPKKNLETFLAKNPVAKRLHLPVVAEDSILSQLFPHVYISHDVWIKDGIVKAITNPQYVNGDDIATVLNNTPVSWPVKRDISAFDYSKPVIRLNEETIPPFSYPSAISYSLLTGNMPDIPHRFTKTTDTASGNIRISLINLPIADLYRFGYGQISLPPSDIILEVKDTSRFVYNAARNYRDQWIIKNTYCYEAQLPASLPQQQVQRKITVDLDFHLGLQSSWEIKSVRCLILVKKQPEKSKTSLRNIYNSRISLQNDPRVITSSYIVYQLNQNLWGMPVLDESGLDSDKILGTAILNFSDLRALSKQLEKYGLEMITAIRPQKMLTITEAR